VQFPRDWLGPRDELVPIDLTGDQAPQAQLPASADAFWSEQAGALHDAVQAPARRVEPREEPSSGGPNTLVPEAAVADLTVAGVRARGPATRPSLAAHALLSTVGQPAGVRRWLWAPLVALIGAIVVLAMIGSAEKPGRTSRRPGRHTSARKVAAITANPSTAALPGSAQVTAHRGDTAGGGRDQHASARGEGGKSARGSGRRSRADRGRTGNNSAVGRGIGSRSGSGSASSGRGSSVAANGSATSGGSASSGGSPSSGGSASLGGATGAGGTHSAGSTTVSNPDAPTAGTTDRQNTSTLTPSAPNQNGSPAAGGPPPP